MLDKNSYIQIQKEVVCSLDGIVSKDELENFREHIETKISNFKPTLMIYGTYNAGKSTLLNALFGQEEMAKTGDVPETKEVHEYVYNGYTIFDTPGMNAKSEDDIVTTEHLEKSEVILFVLSNNGSFEDDFVYQKISEIVKSNKPIIIVLNNKNGIDPESIEAKQSMIKVGENLRKIGDRNNIDKIETKVSLCMVNAKTALKGKIENKELILKKSNIMQLENMIEKVLEESGNKEVVNALNIYIQSFIDSAIDKVDNKIDNKELQKLEELITYLEKLKQSSAIKLKNIVNKNMPSFTDTITSKILSGNDDINAYINTAHEDIIEQLEKVYTKIDTELSMKIDGFLSKERNIAAEYEPIDSSLNNNISEDSPNISDDLKNKIVGTLGDSKVIKEGTKQGFTKLKEWAPEIMKGKGKVWIKKISGRVAIAVNVAVEVYGIYNANKDHQQMIKNERNHLLGAKNSAESIVDSIQSSLHDSIDEFIADTFNNEIIGFKDKSNKLSGDNKSLLDTKDNLRSLFNRLG